MTKEIYGEVDKYYIAYVDLLGYKSFFEKHADKVADFLKTIQLAIEKTKECVLKTNLSPIMHIYADMDVKVKMFSDNILLCIHKGDKQTEIIRLLTFLSLVADIQRLFVSDYGLFLRGGITDGELSFNEDFVFGQGVIDSVEMESKANYPRIVLAQQLVDFLFQKHYIPDCELQHLADIVSKLQRKDLLSNEEQAHLEMYAPQVLSELISSQWKYNLVIKDADGVYTLNYLYKLDVQTLLGADQWQRVSKFLSAYFSHDYDIVVSGVYNYAEMLQSHKEKVQEKLLEYGNYNDIETSDIKSADAREKVLKKYLWVMKFHNFIAQQENMLECVINAQVNCDNRFMKMNVIVLNPINDTV